MSVDEKIARFASMFNEVAIGYDDGGCFWRFQWGPRGAGSMIEGCGERFSALDADDLSGALDALFRASADEEGGMTARISRERRG